MKMLLSVTLAMSCTVAIAQVYKCPQVYPGKDAPAVPLTGASMMWGELHGDGYLHGDDEAVDGGHDIHYGFADDEQGWLVCAYGASKRISGKFVGGREWGQAMSYGGTKWWVKLAPKAGNCTVQIREIKANGPNKGVWTASAVCERSSS